MDSMSPSVTVLAVAGLRFEVLQAPANLVRLMDPLTCVDADFDSPSIDPCVRMNGSRRDIVFLVILRRILLLLLWCATTTAAYYRGWYSKCTRSGCRGWNFIAASLF